MAIKAFVLSLDTPQTNALMAAANTWTALCCAVSNATINRIGRRSSFLICFLGQAVCLIPLAILTNHTYEESVAAAVAFPIFGFLFSGFYGFGAGTVWLYVVELNSQCFRLTGACIASLVAFVSYFVWIFLTQKIDNITGWPAIFIATNVIGALIVCFLCPETTGRSLEYVNRYFRPGKPSNMTNDRRAIQVHMLESEELEE